MFGNSKDSSKGSKFDLDTDLSTLNSKLVDKTIKSHSNILDASEIKTVIYVQTYQYLKLVKNTIKGKTLRKS